MTIAVTGATGQLGRLAIESLKNRVDATGLIALARSPEKAADLGVAARAFDYKQRDGHAAALSGVETLVLISSSDFDDRAGQHRAVIEAAKAAGVKRLVYTSILRCADNPMLLAIDHKTTEADIAASGLTATILRNGWYTENYTGAFAGAVAAGAMIGSAGTGKIASAARADYAEAIAVVATESGHEGQVYELAGDNAYTLAEMAGELSKAVGKTIGYQDMPKAAYADALKSFGLPDGFAAAVSDADACAAEGWLFDEGGALSRLIGRPTTPMAESVAAAARAL